MTPELRLVRHRAAKAAHWRQKLEEAVRQAHDAGAPLRAIAEEAGWSHEQVRRISGSGRSADPPK